MGILAGCLGKRLFINNNYGITEGLVYVVGAGKELIAQASVSACRIKFSFCLLS
jgi:hypothetical protein